MLKHPRRSYVRQRILATPPWLPRLPGETVDHEIPLNHPRVCGLHVPWNFKIVPRRTNEVKNNAWCQWHGDLFSAPEQLRLFHCDSATA